ncbi:high mobility group box, partial [Gonapodya prolifera JEL478]
PRPPNQFVLYRRDKHKEIVISHFEAGMTISNIEISKLVGKMWQQESAEVKAKYAAMQKEEARKHAEMYPGYKYAPRKMVQRRSKR